MPGDKILVVDDEAPIRQALRAALESEGYKVEEAENGKVAVEKCKQWRPRLVMLDVRMPVMDGHMASIEIKYDESLRQTKIIFLTANTDDDSRNYGLGHGAELYLTKPFKVDDLLKKVGEVLYPDGFESESMPALESKPQTTAPPAPTIDQKARQEYLDKMKKRFEK